MRTLAASLFLLALSSWSVSGLQLDVINQWNFLQFTPPRGFSSQGFRPENTIFTGLELTDDRIFIAMPRLRAGIPATLATIPRNTPAGSSPQPQPYPDWSYHGAGLGLDNETTCAGLVSVYRMRVDSCNRLWVLDAGIMTSIDDFQRICNPKLMVFDLKTNQVVRRIDFPRQVLRPSSLLANLIIDESVQGTCDSAFVYVADTVTAGILVFDGLRGTMWRVSHPSMFPDPNFATYTITDESFTLPDGVVGLAHSPKLATLFFQPLATDRIFSIPTATLTKGPPAEFEDIPVVLAGKKSSQGLGLALNPNDDTLYFSPLTETSVASWNPLTNRQELLAYNPELLQFASELRFTNNELWLLTTRFQKFFKRTVSPNEVNLRIIRIRFNSTPAFNSISNNLYFKK
ncbi:L-dopachrome tautomerase yellow-e [Rhynchophorus ferrugineus]|uniref:L-dopachrome tautomerase yellow-e n=1 Tax=Rhynchophorus ferrugineus TaxID=354439 RepID=UPI003FCC44FA